MKKLFYILMLLSSLSLSACASDEQKGLCSYLPGGCGSGSSDE